MDLIARSLAPLTLAAAAAALAYPPLFLVFSDTFLWFFAATMFALGVVLEPREFVETLLRPRELGLGLLTQYSVMPALGFLAAYLSGLEPATALGFVIVGCAPGAMASNVIVYLAGGAVAFSVTLTSLATFLSPLLTPALVKWLGGVFLPIPFWPMMRTILLTVLAPLMAGMILKRLIGPAGDRARTAAPPVAVVAIVVIIGYAVAVNQPFLLETGGLLFAMVAAVNGLGYLAGWFLGGVYRFSPPYRLALTIEIGMQNAGLGVALALRHFSPETALPGALFATWCILTAAVATMILKRRTAVARIQAGAAESVGPAAGAGKGR